MTDGHTDEGASPAASAEAAEAAAVPEPSDLASHSESRLRERPTPRRGTAALPWIAAFVVAAIVVGTAPSWAPFLPWRSVVTPSATAPVNEAALNTIESRLGRVEAALGQLAAANRNTASAPALAALGDRVAALEHRPAPNAGNSQDMAKLHQDLDAASARIDALAVRVAKLETAQSPEVSADRVLLAALAGLRAAIAGSGPFTGELAAVTASGRGDTELEAALKPLAVAAQTGIPSTALLAQRFDAETVPHIERASATAPAAGGDWTQRILARFRSLVVIRRINGNGGNPTETAVAASRSALLDGDLAGAIKALQSLKGPEAAAASPFLALAERRQAAEEAVSKLLRQVAARIAAEGH